MKTLVSIFILIMNSLNIQGQYSTTCNYSTAIPLSDGECLAGDWTLVFEDEFNGTQIDLNIWYPHFGYGTRCLIADNVVFLDENISVANGILKLTLNQNPGYYDCEWGNILYKEYASGMIWSKRSFLYGIFESEIKIPNGTNYFPAFWLWGAGGEIDIFEFYDDESKPQFSTHRWPKEIHHKCTHEHHGEDFSTKYHIYTAYWDPYFVAFFIDGDLIYVHWLFYSIIGQNGITCYNLEAGHEYILSKSFPSHQNEECIILNHGLQTGETPSPLPSEMFVKYVRAWQQEENTCIDKTLSQFNSNYIKGKSITVNGNITVTAGENITLTAQNYIDLTSVLNIEKGALFNAEINSYLCPESTFKSAQMETLPYIDFNQIDSLKSLSPTEILDNNNDLIFIYPNPITDQFSIFSSLPGEMQLIDITGKTIIISKLDTSDNNFNLSFLQSGLYLVKLRIGDKTIVEKIIKE